MDRIDYRSFAVHQNENGSLKEIASLVNAVVQRPDRVVVTEGEGFPLGCEIRVSEQDYEVVISRGCTNNCVTGNLISSKGGEDGQAKEEQAGHPLR
jgi:hypothetical protein